MEEVPLYSQSGEKKLINMKKLHLLSEALFNIQLYQQTLHTFPDNQLVYGYFLNANIISDENELFKKSRIVEPKKNS